LYAACCRYLIMGAEVFSFNKLGCSFLSLLVKHFYTDRGRCELFTGYLSLGRDLAVTERIRDIGPDDLQFSFQTGSSSSPSYCHIFFLIAFLQYVFIRNILIILRINYIIIKYNNNDNMQGNRSTIGQKNTGMNMCQNQYKLVKEAR